MILNWSKYLKCSNGICNSLKEVPCVYIIAIPSLDETHMNVVYIGQTDNIKRRTGEHLDVFMEDNEELFNIVSSGEAFISAAVVRNQSDRDGAERSLYNHYFVFGYLVNDSDHIPNVSPLMINFQ